MLTTTRFQHGTEYLLTKIYIVSAAASAYAMTAASLTVLYSPALTHSLASVVSLVELIRASKSKLKLWQHQAPQEEAAQAPLLKATKAQSSWSIQPSKIRAILFFMSFATVFATLTFKQYIDLLFLWQAMKTWFANHKHREPPPLIKASETSRFTLMAMSTIPLAFAYATSHVTLHRELAGYFKIPNQSIFSYAAKKLATPFARQPYRLHSFRVLAAAFSAIKKTIAVLLMFPQRWTHVLFNPGRNSVLLSIGASSLLFLFFMCSFLTTFFFQGNIFHQNMRALALAESNPSDEQEETAVEPFTILRRLPKRALHSLRFMLFVIPWLESTSATLPILKYSTLLSGNRSTGYLASSLPFICFLWTSYTGEVSLLNNQLHHLESSSNRGGAASMRGPE